MALTRRQVLAGVAVTPLVALAGLGGLKGAQAVSPGVDFRTGWMPQAMNQGANVCTAAASLGALSYLMGRAYGWTHDQRWNPSDVYVKSGAFAAAGRGEWQLMDYVLRYLNQTGVVSPVHPRALIKAGYAKFDATPDAVKTVLSSRLPVLLSIRYPAAWSAAPVRVAKAQAATPETGHELFACGWSSEGVLCLNSYGTAWSSSGGYCLVPWGAWAVLVYEAHALTSVRPTAS